MRGYQNVLVPLDFSEMSNAVIAAALRVLDPEGRATLFHVVEHLPTVTQGTFGVYAHRKDIEEIKRLSGEKLNEYVRAHPGARLEALVKEGKPAATILEAAQSLGADLIVIGTYGRSRLDHLLIGSVAERVLRKAACPVLAVRA